MDLHLHAVAHGTMTMTETVAVDAHVAAAMKDTDRAAAPMSVGPDALTVLETLEEGQGEKEAGLARTKIKGQGFKATEEGLDPAPGPRVQHETRSTPLQRLTGPSRKCAERPLVPGLDPCRDQDLVHGLGPGLGQDASQEDTNLESF